ncbi:MAG: ECF subfamily RNA polymerase sigma factor, RNA polymerase sigma-70 factor, ECF subfamily [candidate division WS6 bacterium GW2011_GWC1_33_20]|uniref:RNA polymerase sigma factor n=2 Tax=Candidatus Dojkabacteria TaxID=74243 RepID=A0A0G0DGH9_9BACT|nr:MAG: ECF subfamily RNA polymerase sigma factor, RNA polymerase sigma-70 factor, ECF subfamily [candidate division WS6 bacterium GW2011_GWE2_33_157]KKP43921.1 MAG: ECF subfamily RNA polymerase sigma factor, RNA polymerase sigma-70 factor, ECF subfamily [candidate division WS6 bacterium GW2011_GWF1_33_233]KKP44751.1 MAG: ECF subfamily RNA polymerase sigma factor, RNA polymerase sigma-70 factor, ECF subfamily [candidate division WS6 bacterium GW2011_GWC1_33_20]KKP52860.1 MAG: ECF subfamily RNA p
MAIKKKKTIKDIDSIPDSQIVEMVLSDVNAYKYIIERYESKLLRYIQRVLYISKEDAEDILQEVFIKAYRNIKGYDKGYSFSSWIYRIAHNEAISFLRKKKITVTNTEKAEIFDKIASDEDIERDFLKDLKGREVRDILSKLETKYREVLVLRYFEEMGYNEISDVLHISSGTVASLINRGKEKFKILVQNYGKNI